MTNKLKDSAFRRGFAAGFSSPYHFVNCSTWRPSYPDTDTVTSAWTDVGRFLMNEITNEGRRLGAPPSRKKSLKSENTPNPRCLAG